MNNETPIFTEDDSVDKEIAENEARSKESHLTGIERTLETVVAPMTRALEDPDLTPEERKQSHDEQERNTRQTS